jgi:hypothetical protein
MYLNLSFRNFWNKKNKFKSYFLFHRQLTRLKHFEMELITDNYHLFSFEFKIGFKEDHSGVRTSLSLFGVECYLHIYDIRHWDYQNNCWHNADANFDKF